MLPVPAHLDCSQPRRLRVCIPRLGTVFPRSPQSVAEGSPQSCALFPERAWGWGELRVRALRRLAQGHQLEGSKIRHQSARLHTTPSASAQVSRQQKTLAEAVGPVLLPVLPGHVQEASGILFRSAILECPSVIHRHLHMLDWRC